MLTYVINTSENKTFDSSKLFELAGYSKIRWLQCSLSEIHKCMEYIYEKQNVITADDFRIAVIVDFFGFDKIRIPYGRKGFVSDDGVDMSLYMPYIEVYLMDNLIFQLENRDLFAADFEIYYIQSEKSERYELFKNASVQIRQILSGNEGKREPTPEEIEQMADREISDKDAEALLKKETRRSKKKRTDEEDEDEALIVTAEQQEQDRKDRLRKKVDMLMEKKTFDELTMYSSYTLYCTPNMSLEFQLRDYPYGSLEMNFEDFWDAFRDRVAIKADLRRHYYITSYGGGASRAALHTLSLSLYLIHLYEREESTEGEGELDVEHLDSRTLCEVLESGWSKINAAKVLAKKNDMKYYALASNSIINVDLSEEDETDAEIAIKRELAALPKEITETKMSGDRLYQEVESYSLRDSRTLKDRNRAEFDQIMSEYLRKRDETREADIEAEFLEMKNAGFLDMTDQCPSQEQYQHLVKEKQRQISTLFEKVLAADYIEVNYTEEKERADEAYLEYRKAKAWLRRNLFSDILFMLLAVASMVIPYYALQLSATPEKMAALLLALHTSAFFAILFVLSIVLQLVPILRRLNKAKAKLYNCYLDCCAKERYSFSALKRRYQKDLLSIENTRYEIRHLKHLFDENLAREGSVTMHRQMLDSVADCLSSMLNNLDIEPTFDPDESVEGEFDVSKSLYSGDNKVYQIFSIETIEKMFQKNKKGRELK